MPFLIDNFRADDQITVNDGTINTTSTSIGLIGKGAEVYGETINENFLHILESFASVNPAGPPNPKLGQLWFQLDTGGPGFHTLNVCRSESPIEWVLVTLGMIEGAFLQGFPFPTVTPVSQKYDKQTLFDANQSEAQLTDGAVVSWDVQNAQVAHLDLAAGTPGVINAASNMQDGGTYYLIITQDGTGGRVMTFASGGTGSYKWPGGSAPVLTVSPNAVDIFTFISDGTFMYGVAQQDFS